MKTLNHILKKIFAVLAILLIGSISANADVDELGENREPLKSLREAYSFYEKVVEDPDIWVVPNPPFPLPLWMDRENAIESIKMTYLAYLRRTGKSFDEKELAKRIKEFLEASNAEKKRLKDKLKGIKKDIAKLEAELGTPAGPIRPGAEGAITGDRAPFQTQNYDVVGSSNKFGKDNKDDWMFAITLRAEGTIEWIEVRNTDGQFSLWDTRPETGNWALGVTRYDKTVLNKRDGSVRFNVSGRTDLYLLAADNGSLQAGKTNYKVRIKFVDGGILERNVGRGSGQPQQVTNSRCDQYARTAVAQNQENIQRRCGYTGARWSDNYQGHYNWCLGVSEGFADSETKAREDGLKKCRDEQGQLPPSQAPVTLWPDVDFVTSLYRTILDREPDAGGLQNWVEWLRKGRSREWVITQFFSSREYQSRRKNDREFVRDLYQAVLGREPDAGGWNNWVNSLQRGMSRQDCLNRFFQSAEYNNIRRLGPPGVTQATGAEVDWNNRPWLDPRVIRCVREYLDKVLIMINQEQMRKSEPPFTLLDDWGRLLRPPQITAQGGVDGDWDNPTHFVWGAYNTIKHRNSLLGGVQDYVKDCVRRGGGGPGPGPPGPQPQPGTNPWETPEGRACFEQWIREATAKMNAYNGSDDYNARKPWRINRYGILEGNPKYGPTSAYAPDNWSQYNGNRYWYMWDYWHAPSGVWGKPDLNAAGVPHIRPYILRCIAGYQQAQPPPQPPPQQALLTARYTGIDRDVVGRGGQATPNGEVDGQFSLRLDTRGFRRVVNFIMLQSANAQGQPTGGQVWDTTPNQYWILGVYRNGRRLNPRDQNISDVVQGIANYQIYGNDSGWFRPGQNFRITVRFADGGESVAYAKVTGTRPLAGVKPVPTPRDDEESPFDENYQQFIQAQTTRDETRTQRVQEQMSIDSMFTASQGGSAGPFTQEGLTAQLDQIQPSSESAASTSTQTSQEQEGTTSTSEHKCETVALNPGSWRQLQNNRGPLSQGQGGLVLHGDEWTNGKLKNGKFDGNGVESNKVFDLKNGGDVYMTFKVNDGGKYLAIFPKVFSEAGYKLLTTDHVWAGSVVVPNNTNLYAHIKVDTNGKYKTTVCKGSYDDKGGSRISDYNGTLKNTKGRVRIRFVDNYAGTKAYLVILKAEVCIPPKTAVAVAPPEPTKPPAKPPTQVTPSKKVLDWQSPAICAEAEGGEYRWRWNVHLTQSGTQVSGNIYFHKCPGGGRVAYAVSGEVSKDGSFKVTGKKVGGRGGLYSSAPKDRIFILNEGKSPNPNFAP